jgi:hypothetical protein
LKALALDSPIVAFGCEGCQVNAGVFTAEVFMSGEIFPHPHGLEAACKLRIRGKIGAHEPLKAVAFVTLGKGLRSVFFENVLEAQPTLPISLDYIQLLSI